MSDEIYESLLKEQSSLDAHMGVHIPLADFDEIDEADPSDW